MADLDAPERCWADGVAIPDGFDRQGNLRLSIDLRPFRLKNPAPGKDGLPFSGWPQYLARTSLKVEVKSHTGQFRELAHSGDRDLSCRCTADEAGRLWWDLFTDGLVNRPGPRSNFTVALNIFDQVGGNSLVTEEEDAAAEAIDGYRYSALAELVDRTVEDRAIAELAAGVSRAVPQVRELLLERSGRRGAALQAAILRETRAPFDPAPKIEWWRKTASARFPSEAALQQPARSGDEDGLLESIGDFLKHPIDTISAALAPDDPLDEMLARGFGSASDTERNESRTTMAGLYRHFRADNADADAEEDELPMDDDEERVLRRITGLQAHPTVRKFLRLIADVKISPQALVAAIGEADWDGTGTLRVTVLGPGAPDVAPRAETAFVFDARDRTFEPRSIWEDKRPREAQHPIERGIVNLNDGRYKIESLDAVAASMAYSAAGVATAEAHRNGVPLDEVPTGQPRLQSRGVMILDTEAADAARRATERDSAASDASAPRLLFADDLVNGFRPLVVAPNGALLSPVARKVTYPRIVRAFACSNRDGSDCRHGNAASGHPYPEYADRDYGTVIPTSRVIEEVVNGQRTTTLSESEVMLTWSGEPMAIPSWPSPAEYEDHNDFRRDGDKRFSVRVDPIDLPVEMTIAADPAAKLPPLRRGARYKFLLLACKSNGGSVRLAEATEAVMQMALGDRNGPAADWYVYQPAERAPAPEVLVPADDRIVRLTSADTPNETHTTLVAANDGSRAQQVTRVLLASAISPIEAEQARTFDRGSGRRGVYLSLEQAPNGGFPPVRRKGSDNQVSAGHMYRVGSAHSQPIYIDPDCPNLGMAFRRGVVRPVGYSNLSRPVRFWPKGRRPTASEVRPVFLTMRARTPGSAGNFVLGRRKLEASTGPDEAPELFVDIAPAEEVHLDIWTFGETPASGQTRPITAVNRYASSLARDMHKLLAKSQALRETFGLAGYQTLTAEQEKELESAMLGEATADAKVAALVEQFGDWAERLLATEPVSAMSGLRTLTLVHPVRQPLAAPWFSLQDPIRFVRIKESNETSWRDHLGRSHPAPPADQPMGGTSYISGRLEVHRASTGAVRCEGIWEEHGEPAIKQVDGSWVHEPVVNRLHFDLPGLPRQDDLAGHDPASVRRNPVDLVRDEAGALRGAKVVLATDGAGPDTRARRVALRLIGTSRFTAYYPKLDVERECTRASAEERDLVAALRREQETATPQLMTFWMNATARPPRPTVTQECLIRKFTPAPGPATASGSFATVRRLYLGRDWNASGQGEMLALIRLPGGDAACKSEGSGEAPPYEAIADSDVPEWALPFITRWGGDISQRAVAMARDYPTLGEIGGYRSVCGDLLLPRPETADGSVRASGGAESTVVSIAAFVPQFDRTRGEWFCDIELSPQLAYSALARLGLARYQPHALDEMKLSYPISLEPFPVQPRWEVQIERTNDVVVAKVFGAAYYGRAPAILGLAGSQEPDVVKRLEQSAHSPNLQFRLLYDATGVQVVADGADVVDVQLAPSGTSAGRPSWTGKLPIPPADRNAALRVLITEVMTHANATAADDAAAGCLATIPTAFAYEARVPRSTRELSPAD